MQNHCKGTGAHIQGSKHEAWGLNVFVHIGSLNFSPCICITFCLPPSVGKEKLQNGLSEMLSLNLLKFRVKHPIFQLPYSQEQND